MNSQEDIMDKTGNIDAEKVQCGEGVFIKKHVNTIDPKICSMPKFDNLIKKKNINIKIKNTKKVAEQNKKENNFRMRSENFIKNVVNKIKDKYKKDIHSKQQYKHTIPVKSKTKCLLNEYLSVNPTNNILYRRKTPINVIYKNDSCDLQQPKLLTRCKSMYNMPYNCIKIYGNNHIYTNNNYVSRQNKKVAKLKISKISPLDKIRSYSINNNNTTTDYNMNTNSYINLYEASQNKPFFPNINTVHNITYNKQLFNNMNEYKLPYFLPNPNMRNTSAYNIYDITQKRKNKFNNISALNKYNTLTVKKKTDTTSVIANDETKEAKINVKSNVKSNAKN
ncbi:putative uncharacterized protein DDB_G0282499 [Piliocolobus tephrosceles]|uniref:putative uncharacterized protein DDB_G0282499 n=1 Tax=Piliocolobus tephrosceles TaxID=591936 RepID=UPI000E6AE837|nr:putative uncharacterized protein DDB_G0282499 [Piliocolobus tephrosceles]